MLPTPPEAPSTSTRSSAVTRASSRTHVERGQPGDAHRRRVAGSTPSGIATTAARGTMAAWAQTPSRAAPRPSPATSTGLAVERSRRLAAERPRQRTGGIDTALGDVAVDRVDAAELELDADLILGGRGQLDLVHDERLRRAVQASSADVVGAEGASWSGRF